MQWRGDVRDDTSRSSPFSNDRLPIFTLQLAQWIFPDLP